MENYKLMELRVIYDLLASHTESYTQMLNSGTSYEDFRLCREIILELQAEIAARKMTGDPTLSEPNNIFDEEAPS